MTSRDVVLDQIIEGDRHRRDLGDIKSLAESMTEVGLLHPVVLTESMQLIAGGRRIAAARSLGWVEIPANVVSNIAEADLILQAESDENTCRKDFTPTEAVALKQAREALLKPLAKQRMSDGGKGCQVDNPSSTSINVRKTATRGTGYSATTLSKVEKVQDLADDPATAEPVRDVANAALVEIDATGKVDGPAKRVTTAQQAQQAVDEFEELQHYVDSDERDKAIRLAATLRGLAEPERSQRRENLRRRIAADVREAAAPQHAPTPVTPDYEALAHRMFDAINDAARVVKKCGGAETLSHLAGEDPLMVDNWRAQFDDMAATCALLAQALTVTPNLRSVK